MTRPINILTLASFFPNAATPNLGVFIERQTAELARRQEIDLTVINPIGVPIWPFSGLAAYAPLRQLPLQEDWHGLPVYRPRFGLIPGVGGPFNPAAIVRAILPLVRRLHATRPFDLIDAEFFYPDGPAAMRLAAALNIPFTIKARGADIHHWAKAHGCAGQIRKAANAADGLLAVSQALKTDMVALGMAEEKIRVHYTGLDQNRFHPVDRAAAKAQIGIDGPAILSVGALIPRKRQDLLIKSLVSLGDVRLMLAGTGPWESALRNLADQLGVADRVRFIGSVPHDALPVLLNAADVMALVSKSEGLANAWVEALACGTPIVISDAGGAAELLTSPDAGSIVPPEADAIASAVRRLIANPPNQAHVSAQVSQFSWQTNGDQLVEFFQSILKNKVQS